MDWIKQNSILLMLMIVLNVTTFIYTKNSIEEKYDRDFIFSKICIEGFYQDIAQLKDMNKANDRIIDNVDKYLNSLHKSDKFTNRRIDLLELKLKNYKEEV